MPFLLTTTAQIYTPSLFNIFLDTKLSLNVINWVIFFFLPYIPLLRNKSKE